MAGKKRRGGRRLARFVAIFGLPAGCPRDYGEFLGLALNEDVALRVKALSIALAREFEGRLGDRWAAALSESEGQGAEEVFKFNAARSDAAAKARMGW